MTTKSVGRRLAVQARLTKAQSRLLAYLQVGTTQFSGNRRRTVDRLETLGLVEVRQSRYGGVCYATITDAGRAWLAAKGPKFRDEMTTAEALLARLDGAGNGKEK